MSEPLESAISALDKGYTETVELLHSQEKLINHLRAELVEAKKADQNPGDAFSDPVGVRGTSVQEGSV